MAFRSFQESVDEPPHFHHRDHSCRGMLIVAFVKPDILKLILSLLTMVWNFFWDLVFRVIRSWPVSFPAKSPWISLPGLPCRRCLPNLRVDQTVQDS